LAAVDDFITAHRGGWEDLESLVRRAGQDPRGLTAEEIERLGQLYRHVTSDLAVARRDFPLDQATRYLNDLAARAHPLLYRAPAGAWRRLGHFFLLEFPRLFRSAGPFVLVAFLMFMLPALAGYLVASANPGAAEKLLPDTVTRTVRQGHLWTSISANERPVASSFIMTNNIRVAILSFAGGILLGTLAAYVLVSNGLSLGAIMGYTQAYGLAADLGAFVSPHGYLELSVIFISGGAGLQLGWAVLSPGLLSRRDALGQAAQRAAQLLLGAVPLLVVAGLIEGFVSPSGLPDVLKYTFGLATGCLLYWFLLTAGRPRRLRFAALRRGAEAVNR
jgi:uncharacterized membrane protein SpoIIM required for sporulation